MERQIAVMGRIEELLTAGQFEAAHKCAVDALIAAPNDVRALLVFARTEVHLGSLDRALWAAERACAAAPDEPSAQFVRAEILGKLGRSRDELTAVRLGLALAPGSRHGQQLLVVAFEHLASRRAARWRVAGAALFGVLTAAAAAVVAVPHGAPWGLLVVAAGCSVAAASWMRQRHDPVAQVSVAQVSVAQSPAVRLVAVDGVSVTRAEAAPVLATRSTAPLQPMASVGA